ncbi:MAG: enoyl-CoA hydratase [Pseudomonadota bacterium]
MNQSLIIREDRDGVASLTMNSPDNLNALSEAMMAALKAALEDIAGDGDVRAVTLTGAGRAFCAGHDLKEIAAAREGAADGGRAFFNHLFAACSTLMMEIMRLPKPVIALPRGVAAAAGCQLVATCDLAIAAEGTKFGVNGVNIGLFCSTPMVALSRVMPRKKVMEMLLTGAFIEADEARAAGLVNAVVPGAELAGAGFEMAGTIAGKLDKVVAIGKEAFYAQAELPLAAAYEYTADIMAENLMMRETEAAIDAFLNKPRLN